MNKKKTIIALLILVVVGTIIFWKRSWIKEKLGFGPTAETTSEDPAETNNEISPRPQPSPIYIPKTLYTECSAIFKLGCKGDKVKKIQESLNKNFNAGLTVDGYFGPQTENALVKAGFKKELSVFEAVRLMYMNKKS